MKFARSGSAAEIRGQLTTRPLMLASGILRVPLKSFFIELMAS
jgi:hypothetical protein